MNIVYNCSMSAGFGFADVLPPPLPFFDDGRSLYFAVYVRFNRTFPPNLAATVVPAHTFIAAPAAVTVSTLSAAGVEVPPGALHTFAMSMSSFAASAASSAACRILPLCVHVTAVNYLPLTFYHINNYALRYPLTNYYFEAPGLRPGTARFSPSPRPPEILATTRGYEYAGYDTAEEAFEVAADLEGEDEEEDEYEDSDYTAEEAFEVAANLESEDAGEDEEEDEDGDDTAEEAFEVAAEGEEEEEDEDDDDTAEEDFEVAAYLDLDLRLGESTADHAAENKRAFKEKLPSPESDESEDTEEDEDSDDTVAEALQGSADLDLPLTESTQAHAAAVEVENSSPEDRESETEPNFLNFEHFFSEEEDEAEAGGSMSSATAAQADDGGLDDDDGRVLLSSLDVSNSESSSLFALIRSLFRFDYYRDTFLQTNIGRRSTPIEMMASEVDYSSLVLSEDLLASRHPAIFTLDDSGDDDDDDGDDGGGGDYGDGGDGDGDDGGGGDYGDGNGVGDSGDGDGDGDGGDGGGDGDGDGDGVGDDGDGGDDEISDDSSGYDDDDINAEEFMLGVVPATEASIEALEVVTMSTKTCTICLEGCSFLIESNGHDYHEDQNGNDRDHDRVVFVRMPCFHVYHKVCIAEWLQRSHLCPLCRYSMPTAQDL